MKHLFLLLTAAAICFGQNPDGKNASLHLAPVWTWGSADYARSTAVWYPPSQASNEQSVLSYDQGTLSRPFEFGFSSSLKVPATSYLTVGLSYSFRQHFEEFSNSVTETKYFSQYWKTNGFVHSVGFTVSVYNLFSVYQGD
jgi:hypothetical protein